jgi:hypothetical protein
MTCLTPPHPDVPGDIFFIMDFGIALVVNEFDTVYFCGLRFHGGAQPRYKEGTRMDVRVHTRITLIAYPPATFFDIPASTAFGSLPGILGSNSYYMRIFKEMKDYA